jgi:branched-chain amino acid transport system substrate-binding protein
VVEVGTLVDGRYRVDALLGEGGMAVVYRAFDTRLKRDVALKVVKAQYAAEPGFLARFEREATSLAQMRHAGIVEVHDYGEDQGLPYLVMDYVPGGSLSALANSPLPAGQAAALIAPVARALEYAHQRAMLHRDIKPANLLVDADGKLLLSDFGIVKILSDQASTSALTGTGTSIGTPDYMAPEQWLGQPSPQSDVYSLGIVLYELVTGQRPYKDVTPVGLFLKHREEPLTPPRMLRADVSPAADAVICKALAKKPEDRFASMATFAAVLETLAGETKASAAAGTNAAENGQLVSVPQPVEAVPVNPQPKLTPAETPRVSPPVGTRVPAGLDGPVGVRSGAATQYSPAPPRAPQTLTDPAQPAAEPPVGHPPAGQRTAGPVTRVRKIPTWAWIAGGVGGIGIAGVVLAAVLLLALNARSLAKTNAAKPTATTASLALQPSEVPAPTNTRPAAAATAPSATARPESTATLPLFADARLLQVAILVPLSGPVPTFGESARDGALLAVKEWNDRGGVLGMKILAVVEDGQCTPDPALNAARKLIDQDKVHYIIGEVCSKASIPVSEYATAKNVIMISPTSTNPAVTVGSDGKTKPFIFRACFIDPFQGVVGAKFAFNTLEAKTVFILYDQSNDYVQGLATYFEKSFSALGGKVVGKEAYSGRDTDFGAILAKVAAAKPDMIYLPDYYNIVNLVTKQAKERGITVPFLGGDGWDSTDLDLKAADGGYYTNHYSPDDPRPVVQDFIKAYGAEYQNGSGAAKVPDALATLAYDSTNLLLQAIAIAGADDTARVNAVLESIEFDGVSGTITFDPQHNPIKSAVILAVRDGKVVFDSIVNP